MTESERRGIDEITIELVPSRGIAWAQRFVSERYDKLSPFKVTERGFARDGTEVKPMKTWAKHLAMINTALGDEEGGA